MFVLADKHLKPIFPKSLYKHLEPFVDSAELYLANYNKTESDWTNKVAFVTQGMQFEPTNIDNVVLYNVFEALFKKNKLQLSYQSVQASKPEDYKVSPYGLFVREDRKYLLVKFEGHSDLREIALSRISAADILQETAQIEKDFSLADYIAENNISRKRQSDKIEISLWITEYLSRLLDETPLSKDQVIESYDEYFKVTATVDDTEELRHWLISMCNHATVLTPLSLRNEIKKQLIDSLEDYKD